MIKKNSFWLKVLSFALCCAMLIGVFPAEALTSAREAREASEEAAVSVDESQDSVQTDGIASATILRELVDQREANIKRFEMSDGTVTAAVYEDAVHYYDNGVWKNIDNTLGADASDDVTGYSNAKNDFSVKLADDTQSDYLMKFSKGDYSMTWSAGNAGADESASSDSTESAGSAETGSSSAGGIIGSIAGKLFGNRSSQSDSQALQLNDAKLKIYDQDTQSFERASEEKNPPHADSSANALLRSSAETDALADAEADEAVDEKNYNEDFSLTNEVTSTAMYENIFYNVDIEYQVEGSGLKENIMVKKALDNYRFDFTVDAPGLTFTLLEDGSIAAYAQNTAVSDEASDADAPTQTSSGTSSKDDDLGGASSAASVDESTLSDDTAEEAVFTIPVPFMYDSDGETSENVHYEIAQNADGSWTISTIADEDWINDSERSFPVVIDPAISTPQKSDGIRTAYVTSNEPTVTKNQTIWMEVGTYAITSSTTTTSRSYLDITLPTLEAGAVPVAANLYTWYSSSFANTSAKQEVDLYQLTSSFSENTNGGTTWNNQPSVKSDALDYSMNSYTGSTSSNMNYSSTAYDITSAVKEWYENPSSQYGFMLKAKNENVSPSAYFKLQYLRDKTCMDYLRNSRDGYPFLTVAYRQTNGVEDYWSYTSVDAGRSGTAAVNNFSGNLVMTQPICGVSGNLMPVSVSMVYNSGREIGGNGISPFANTGIGWQTNYNIYVGYSGIDKYWFYLNDSDGTKHYFYFEGDGNTTSGKDEDGLGYTFTSYPSVQTDGSTQYYYKVEDKDGGKMLFNGEGYLVKICDTNSNSIKVNYGSGETGKNKILSITDGAGRNYTYQYGNSSLPTRVTGIVDPTGKTTSFTYAGDLLQMITFSDSTKVEFAYNTGLSVTPMTCVDRHDGTQTSITYNASNSRVTNLNWGTSGTVNTGYSFSYSTNQTDIMDKDGKTLTYQFNNFGQTKGIIDRTSGMAQYYEQGAPGIKQADSTVNPTANKTTKESDIQQSTVNYLCNGAFNNGGISTSYNVEDSGTSKTMAWDSLGNVGNGSARITRSSAVSSGYTYYTQSVGALPAGYYTLSGYISTNGATLSGTGAALRLETWNGSTVVSGSSSEKVTSTGSGAWQKVSVTIYLDGGNTLKALFGYDDGATYGTAYFDDLQVEYGETVNSCNMITNSNFTNNDAYWGGDCNGFTTVSESEGLPGGGNAVYLTGSATAAKGYYTNSITVSGSKGDVFSFGGWAKAASAAVNGIDRSTGNPGTSAQYNPVFQITFKFYNGSTQVGSTAAAVFNANSASWQFIGAEAIASGAYTRVVYTVEYTFNINTAYFARPYLYKESYGSSYTYDKDGNVVSAVDEANTTSTFSYKNDQLSALTSPTGSSYLYGYDDSTKNLTSAVTSSGQEYSFTYDSKGNATKSVISSNAYATSLTTNSATDGTGTYYYIRNAYSGNSMDSNGTTSGNRIHNWSYSETNTNQMWRLVSAGSTDVYYLVPKSCNSVGYRLDVAGASTADNATVELYAQNTSSAQKIKLVQNSDGTYTMKTGSTSYSKCIDGQPGSLTETTDGSPIYQYTYDENDRGQKWYFYPVDSASSQTIETTAAYTSSQNYLASVTDQMGEKTGYNYNETNGQLTSTTDSMLNTTSYAYDSNDRVTGVSIGDVSNAYTYDSSDRLSTISHSNGLSKSVKYTFGYDSFGRNTSVTYQSGGSLHTLVNNTFNSRNLLTQVRYGNANYAYYTYDDLDRLTNTRYSNVTGSYAYVYNKQSSIGIIKDTVNSINTTYSYDLADRLVGAKQVSSSNGTLRLNTTYNYDAYNRLKGYTLDMPSVGKQTFEAVYGNAAAGQDADKVYSVKWNGSQILNYTYDSLGRLATRSLPMYIPVNTTYTYYDQTSNSSKTSTRIKNIYNNLDSQYRYYYDSEGRITQVTDADGYIIHYTYDSEYGWLIREDNQRAGTTIQYYYDTGGNITRKCTYAYTVHLTGAELDTIYYGYSSQLYDQMSSYDGQTITYDGVGNPLTYRDGMSFTWQAGRQMKTAKTSDGVTYTFKYDQDGNRLSKTASSGTTTNYILNGGALVGETRTTGTTTQKIAYILDENGTKIGLTVNGVTYYYLFNAQGDVMALTNAVGDIVAEYVYDAWGKVVSVLNQYGTAQTTATFIGNVNPIRYRGYYYDTETKLYYLQSRYYDPETCRFVNMDAYVQTGSGVLDKNMYIYCEDDPVNLLDPDGRFVIGIGITLQGGAVSGAAMSAMLVLDSCGNYGIIMIPSATACTPQASAAGSVMISWCETIYDLEGISYGVGGSVDLGISVGADAFWDVNNQLSGININIGGGIAIPFDIHGGISAGYLVWAVNGSDSDTSSDVSNNSPSSSSTSTGKSLVPKARSGADSKNNLVYTRTSGIPIYSC